MSDKLNNSILSNLGFKATSDQELVAGHLDSFTYSNTNNPVYILKGYAGTGKTSMISAFVESLANISTNFVLLAPTGRAAKVLSKYTGHVAHTVHRYIYFYTTSKDGITNIILGPNKLSNTIFIIDESSMISDTSQNNNSLFGNNSLLDDIITFVFSNKGNKLLLVGDTAQLPPVGINLSPALDIENIKRAYSVTSYDFEMKKVMRQALDSEILRSATNIRQKIEVDDLSLPYYISTKEDDIQIINDTQYFGELLMESFTDSESDDAIIICRSNKSANIYNQQIRNRILFRESEVEVGDLMMVVKNNYFWLEKGSKSGFIANGDIIRIIRYRMTEEVYGFRFADVDIQLVDYPDEKEISVKILLDTIDTTTPGLPEQENKKFFKNLEDSYMNYSKRRTRLNKIKVNPYYNALHVKFSYAMTCHKTQGGQWKNVFVDKGFVKKDTHDIEFLRWLYTATTRATNKLNLIGFSDEYFKIIDNE